MIDKAYQEKGYGKGAVELAINFIRYHPVEELNTAGCHMNLRMRLHGNYIGLSVLPKRVIWTITALMTIRLVKRYAPEQFTFEVLKSEYGIFAVRGPRGVPNLLSAALKG